MNKTFNYLSVNKGILSHSRLSQALDSILGFLFFLNNPSLMHIIYFLQCAGLAKDILRYVQKKDWTAYELPPVK